MGAGQDDVVSLGRRPLGDDVLAVLVDESRIDLDGERSWRRS